MIRAEGRAELSCFLFCLICSQMQLSIGQGTERGWTFVFLVSWHHHCFRHCLAVLVPEDEDMFTTTSSHACSSSGSSDGSLPDPWHHDLIDVHSPLVHTDTRTHSRFTKTQVHYWEIKMPLKPPMNTYINAKINWYLQWSSNETAAEISNKHLQPVFFHVKHTGS